MLTLEPGRYYRTRSGQKAYVAAVNADADPLCFAIGWVGELSWVWSSKGTLWSSGEHPNDLIDEWREPVKRKVEMLLIRGTRGYVYPTFDRIAHPAETVIARKTVELVEGEGL